MCITIPILPPSNNKNQGHTGKRQMQEYQDAKNEFADYIFLLSKKPKKPYEKAVVVIDYYFKDRIRRDADNYAGKIIHDGLVKARIIKDDSYNNIVSMPFFHYDKQNPRTVITIIEKSEIEAIRAKIRGIMLGI